MQPNAHNSLFELAQRTLQSFSATSQGDCDEVRPALNAT